MKEEKSKRTELSGLGEFGLIERIKQKTALQQATTLYGIGDDCAVLDGGDKKILLTTDLLVEGVHFDMVYTPLKHLGYKAVVVNLSDVAAMNAEPAQITLSLALSNRYSLEAIDEFMEGVHLACKRYKVDLVGGDTTTAPRGLLISVTAIGYANEEDIVYRHGACEKDLICVTGDLGGAYAALTLLRQQKAEFLANPNMQPSLDGKEYIIERQLKPEARVDMVGKLRELGVKPTAMMDISDGLASEIKHICKQSNTGALLFEDKLPIDQQTWDTARSFNLDPTTVALNGGEDYELLFTLAQDDYDKIKNMPDISVIGYITEPAAGIHLITKNGLQTPIEAQGWDGLKSAE